MSWQPKEQVFFPVVGQEVSNTACKVFSDEVIEVLPKGFICKKSGRWEGTTEGWV